MKKLLYILAIVLLAACLVGCDTKITKPTIRHLVGTWDLVSETTTFHDGTTATVMAEPDTYIVITEDSFTSVCGKTVTTFPFLFDAPHFTLAGENSYDLAYLSTTELKLWDNSTIQFLVKNRLLKYRRR